MNNHELLNFVANELAELETRDVDQLYGCLQDSLAEMSIEASDELDSRLYAEIERQVEAEERADDHAKGGAE